MVVISDAVFRKNNEAWNQAHGKVPKGSTPASRDAEFLKNRADYIAKNEPDYVAQPGSSLAKSIEQAKIRNMSVAQGGMATTQPKLQDLMTQPENKGIVTSVLGKIGDIFSGAWNGVENTLEGETGLEKAQRLALDHVYQQGMDKTQYAEEDKALQNNWKQEIAKTQEFGGLRGGLGYKSLTESLPMFGDTIKTIRENPEIAQYITFAEAAKNTPGVVWETAKGYAKAPINFGVSAVGAVDQAMGGNGEISGDLPVLGHIQSRQKNTRERIMAGENPIIVALEEGAGTIMDGLFLYSIVQAGFAPRSVSVAKGKIPNTEGVSVDGQIPQYPKAKSFRLFNEPTNGIIVPKEVLEAEAKNGFPFSKQFNPNFPTYVKTTGAANGQITREIIQVQPSIWSKIKGNIKTLGAKSDVTGKGYQWQEVKEPPMGTVVSKQVTTADAVEKSLPNVIPIVNPKTGVPEKPTASVDESRTSLVDTTPEQSGAHFQNVDKTLQETVIGPVEEKLAQTQQIVQQQNNPETTAKADAVAVEVAKLKEQVAKVVENEKQAFQSNIVDKAIEMAQQAGIKFTEAPMPTNGNIEIMQKWSPEWQKFAANVLDVIAHDPKASKTKITDIIKNVIDQYNPETFSLQQEEKFVAPAEQGALNLGVQKDILSQPATVKSLTSEEFKAQEIKKIAENRSGQQRIVTDPARIQQIEDSIAEGELILRTGSFNGRKFSPEEIKMVEKSVESAKSKLGKNVVNEEKLLSEISESEVKLREVYSAHKDEVEKAMGEIWQEMESSQAGEKLYNWNTETPGNSLEVTGIPSSFPDWIEEPSLRSTALFNKVMAGLYDITEIKYPGANKTAQRALYDVLLEQVDALTGLDTSELRSKIIQNYDEIQSAKSATKKESNSNAEVAGNKKQTDSSNERSSTKTNDKTQRVETPSKQVDKNSSAKGDNSQVEDILQKSDFEKDINIKTIEQSYQWSSHFPEKGAKSDFEGYVENMKSTYDELRAIAVKQDKVAEFEANFDRFRKAYISRYNKVVAARSRTASAMVTGPANFPTSKNRDRIDTYMKASNELDEFKDKVLKKIKNELTGSGIISSDDVNAVSKLEEKLKVLESYQATMKAANKIIKEGKGADVTERLIKEAGLSEKAAAEIQKSYMGKQGFQSFSLTNNNAKIKSTRERIAQLQKAQNSQDVATKKFNGGELVENKEQNRLQLLFDEKPSAEMIATLKSRGFKWSPRNKAWQRQLTDNARKAAASILKVSDEKAANISKVENSLENSLKTDIVKAEIEKFKDTLNPNILAEAHFRILNNKIINGDLQGYAQDAYYSHADQSIGISDKVGKEDIIPRLRHESRHMAFRLMPVEMQNKVVSWYKNKSLSKKWDIFGSKQRYEQYLKMYSNGATQEHLDWRMADEMATHFFDKSEGTFDKDTSFEKGFRGFIQKIMYKISEMIQRISDAFGKKTPELDQKVKDLYVDIFSKQGGEQFIQNEARHVKVAVKRFENGLNGKVSTENAAYISKGDKYASVGEFTDKESPYSVDNIKTVKLPELVAIAKQLTGNVPIVQKMRGMKLGHFIPTGDGIVAINKDIFKNVDQAAKVLAHEIGHLADYLPDHRMDRGNLLGRIATLNRYAKNFIPETPGAENNIITPKDRNRLRAEATKLAQTNETEETITRVVSEKEPTTDELLEVFRGTTEGIADESLSSYIKQLSSNQKVEIAKQAMKGEIPAWVNFKRRQTETVTIKTLDNSPAVIKAIYKKLLVEEIQKRRLFSQEQIKSELTALTHKWKPFNVNLAPESYVKYRMSSPELYADAISVLFNDPGLLKNDAPTFYQAFFNYMDTKPEFKQAFFETQELLESGSEAVTAKRRETLRGSFKDADRKSIDLENKKIEDDKASKKSWWDNFKRELVTVNQPMIDKINAAKKAGAIINEDDNPIFYLREQRYLGGQIKTHIEKNIVPIMDTLTENGMSEIDLGEILFYERITKGDRGEVANPGGLQPEFVQEVFGEDVSVDNTTDMQTNSKTLKATLGEEKFNILQKAANDFRAVLKGTFEMGFQEGLYNDKLMEIVQANDFYVPFKTQQYMGTKTKYTVASKKGTFSEIENPVNTSIEKQIAIIRAIERNKVSDKAVTFLAKNFPEDITPSQTRYINDHHEIVYTRDPKKGTIVVMREGKPVGVDVDKYIADSINDSTVEVNNALVKILALTNSHWFRPIFTTFNLGFQLGFNPIRDFKRFWRNIPGMTLANALGSYVKAAPIAFRKGFDMQSDILSEMYQNKVLSISFNDIIAGAAEDDTQLDLILERAGVFERSTMKPTIGSIIKRNTLGRLEQAGNVMEALPKVAAYMLFKDTQAGAPLTMGQKDFIRRYVGSPDFLEKGSWTKNSNNVFLFSNAIIQGVTADAEIFTQPSTRAGAWWRFAKSSLLPKILMWAAGAGFFGAYIKDIFDGASEYDKTNYIIVPVGINENGKSVYVRMPDDESARFLTAIVWKVINMGKSVQDIGTNLRDIASLFGGQLPTVSPAASIPIDVFRFATGQNVYDSFRGRMVLNDQQMKASWNYKVDPILKYLYGEMGLSSIYALPTNIGNVTTLEKALKIPGINNIFGRFIKVTDQGKSEEVNKLQIKMDQEQADLQLERKAAIEEVIKQAEGITPQEKEILKIKLIADLTGNMVEGQSKSMLITSIKKKFEIGLVKGTMGSQLDDLIYAPNNEQKAAMLNLFETQMTPEEYAKMKTVALDKKIISEDVIAKQTERKLKEKSGMTITTTPGTFDMATKDAFFLGSNGQKTDQALNRKRIAMAIRNMFPSIFDNDQKYNMRLSEDQIDRQARDYTFKIFPFTDAVKRVINEKTAVNSSADKRDYGGLYFESGGQPFTQGEVKIQNNSSIDTGAHEFLHAYIMETGTTRDPKWTQEFNTSWEKEKRNNSEMQSIDRALSPENVPEGGTALYAGIDAETMANERFAYLGGNLGQGGLNNMPAAMQTFYKGVLKETKTKAEIAGIEALITKQDEVAQKAADGKISENEADRIFSAIDNQLKNKYKINQTQTFENYLGGQ